MKQIKKDYKGCKKHPLTHPQKRIWYIEKIYPNTAIHNIGGIIQIMGNINFLFLEKSIQNVIKTNKSLRIQLSEENDRVFQEIVPYRKKQIRIKNFTNRKEPYNAFRSWVKAESEKPFSLLNNPLYDFALFEVEHNYKGCLIKLHHIIADGWSMEIITNQIMQSYRAYQNNQELNESSLQSYFDYLDKESDYKTSPAYIRDQNFWVDEFKELQDNAVFYKDVDIKGARVVYTYPVDLSQKIRSFVASQKITLNTFFITCYLLFLYKNKGTKDITIGIPVINRAGAAQKKTTGMYTTSMPFRFQVASEKSVINVMKDINEKLFHCYRHQRYPYDLLVHDLNQIGYSGLSGLFTDCVNLYNTNLISEIGEYKVLNEQFYPGCQIYSLNMNIKDWSNNGQFTIDFDYQMSKYTEEDILHIYKFMFNLSEQIIEDSVQTIQKIDGLDQNYKIDVLNIFNRTQSYYPENQMIHTLFESQAEKTPERIAVCHGNISLTYKQLNKRACQLAHLLIQSGVKQLDYVGIMATHSIQTIVAILAILKAGAAYIPIDPDYPTSRIRYMVENANITALLVNNTVIEDFEVSCPIIDINKYNEIDNTSCLLTHMQVSDPAYVIYTSGSTGNPKGVVIEHRALVNYIWWAIKNYKITYNDIFPLYSSFSFDLTITSIFSPLIIGGKIIIYSSENDYSLFNVLKENKATIIKLTPSHLALIKEMDNSQSSITRMIVGGENLSVSLAKRIYESFGRHIEIYNEYGPTEATVGCMTYLFNPSIDKGLSVPIGKPADNVQIYILNCDMNPVPVGQIGEIYISGDGVAKGYLNQPYLTEQKFLDNCFLQDKRMFKTGDLARFNFDWQIEFCGRNDSQIKIQGYRIELDEIEKAMLSIKGIQRVIIIPDNDAVTGKYLKAYFSSETSLDINEIRKQLIEILPVYMIPRYFYRTEKIPLTRNGKVDLAALKKISEQYNFVDKKMNLYDEKALTVLKNAIQEVIQKDDVNLYDNYYHIGGDSIQAIQISTKLEIKGYHLSVQDILLYPVIREMLEKIRKVQIETFNGKALKNNNTEIMPTPIMHCFLRQNFDDIGHYNQSILFKIDRNLKFETIHNVIKTVILRHPIFSLNRRKNSQCFFYQNKLLEEPDVLKNIDLSKYNSKEQQDLINSNINAMDMCFDIEKDLLIKGICFTTGMELYVFLTAHHISIDWVSWLILLEEIHETTNLAILGQQILLPELNGTTYADWSNMLYQDSLNLFEKELPFWNKILEAQISYRQYFSVPKDMQLEIAYHRVMISKTELTALYDSDIQEKSFIEAMFLSALSICLYDYTQKKEIYIMMESHGRMIKTDMMDVTKTIGWFTSLYPFSYHITDHDLSKMIMQVQQTIQVVPNYGVGYGVLKYIHNLIETHEIEYPILFNYLGDFRDSDKLISLTQCGFPQDVSQTNRFPFLFDVNIMLKNENVDILFRYDKAIITNRDIEKFSSLFKKMIISVWEHEMQKQEKVGLVDYSILNQKEIDLLFE